MILRSRSPVIAARTTPRLRYGQTIDLPGCRLTVLFCDRWPSSMNQGEAYPVAPAGHGVGTVAGIDERGKTRFFGWTSGKGWWERWPAYSQEAAA